MFRQDFEPSTHDIPVGLEEYVLEYQVSLEALRGDIDKACNVIDFHDDLVFRIAVVFCGAFRIGQVLVLHEGVEL